METCTGTRLLYVVILLGVILDSNVRANALPQGILHGHSIPLEVRLTF